MTDITVEGYSDDLIELEGGIRDEVDCFDTAVRLTFDNGAVLLVEYDRDRDGIWRIEDKSPASGLVTVTRCEDRPGYTDPDGDIYSDLAVVTGAAKVKAKKVEGVRRGD